MTYVAGQWNAICDRCGFKYKSSRIRKEWSGLRVCSGPGTNDCWEPRHPQDSLRGKPDHQAVAWARPNNDGPDVFPGSGNEVSQDDL